MRASERMNFFFDLLVALVGNLVFCLRAKSETKSVTPDTAFRFNSKDNLSKKNEPQCLNGSAQSHHTKF
jgi:hypothetical protein